MNLLPDQSGHIYCLLLSFVLLFGQTAQGQIPDLDLDNTKINDSTYTIVDQMPQYPGGEDAMFRFLGENMHYPEEAQKAGIQGVVFCTFQVDKHGDIQDLQILRGIHTSCDAEVIRVVRYMPAWNPGKQDGKPVRVQYNLPVRFTLPEPTPSDEKDKKNRR